MPDAPFFCKWLEQSWVGGSIRQSLWLFPAIETVHLLGMAVLVVAITVFDLRLLGWALPRTRASVVGQRLLPWVWGAFAAQVITGGLLFSSEAVKVYLNPAFRFKMLLIVVAGAQALLFQQTLYARVASWNDDSSPLGARMMGFVSILLWLGIVAAGRFIGFV